MLNKFSFALLFLLTVALYTAAQKADAPRLPATEAGQRVEAYIKAFNSGDEQTMRAFISNNIADASLKRRSIADRIQVYKEMLGNMKKLELHRVLEASPSAITALFQTGKGEWVEFSFEFEPEPPHKILGLRVEDTDAPSESNGTATNGGVMAQAKLTEAEFIAALEKHLGELVKADEFSGAVLVAKNGRPFFQKAYGLASKEYNVANRLDTKFNLGSINKIFTQVAIGQLAEQGKLTFDDTLAKHLTDYPNREAAEKITIRQLLSMTSGVGDFFGDKFDATPKDKLRTLKDFIPLFANEPLAFEPGTKQQYSNGGYILLGAIIEKLSGQSYYDYVRENIFKPAGMENTDSFEADASTPNLASGYTRRGSANGSRRNNFYTRPARGSSAGGGYSTVEDMLKFTIALQSGRLRQPDFRKSTSNVNGSGEGKTGNGVGVGIAGGAPGINGVVEHDPSTGYTIIVMSNYDPPSAESVSKRIRQMLKQVGK
jgi:CubicO group peptidase (beta-lactamase class C family)